MSKMSELEYETRMAAEPKFVETYCSQCGQNLGPGDSGVSHCKDHMRLEQPRPSLRDAAQAVCDRWDSPNWTHEAVHTGELIAALREALRDEASNEMEALTPSEYQELAALTKTHRQLDEALEYELIGTLHGTYGGRWTLAAFAEHWSTAWPDNTAVYVRRGSSPKIGEQLGEQELKLRNFELKANVTSKFLEWHAEVVKLAVLAERERVTLAAIQAADETISAIVEKMQAAVLAEREACAVLVEQYTGAWDDQGFALSQAIRARGHE